MIVSLNMKYPQRLIFLKYQLSVSIEGHAKAEKN